VISFRCLIITLFSWNFRFSTLHFLPVSQKLCFFFSILFRSFLHPVSFVLCLTVLTYYATCLFVCLLVRVFSASPLEAVVAQFSCYLDYLSAYFLRRFFWLVLSDSCVHTNSAVFLLSWLTLAMLVVWEAGWIPTFMITCWRGTCRTRRRRS